MINQPKQPQRCFWCDGIPEFVAYHDTEWGFPVADDARFLVFPSRVAARLTFLLACPSVSPDSSANFLLDFSVSPDSSACLLLDFPVFSDSSASFLLDFSVSLDSSARFRFLPITGRCRHKTVQFQKDSSLHNFETAKHIFIHSQSHTTTEESLNPTKIQPGRFAFSANDQQTQG